MRLFFVTLIAAVALGAAAQSPYEYYYNNALLDDEATIPETDNELFIRQLRGDGNVFDRLSEFNFSFIKWGRRGYERWMNEEFWGGLKMGGIVSYSPDYQLFSVLRQGKNANYFANDARSLIREGGRVQGLFFNRKGRGGVRASYGLEIPRKDAYMGLSLSHRAGRDPNIGGVFMDESSLLAAADFGDFSISVAALRSENGLRSYAMEEVFALTGDKYYNPSWGWYNGEQRSSRAINSLNINVVSNWTHKIGYTDFEISMGYRAGRNAKNGLAWFDAATPYPDYYMYMPGDFEPEIINKWSMQDPRITQIDWENIVNQNLNRPDQAAYVLENRVEKINNFQFSATGKSLIADGVEVSYGVDYQQDTRVRYKQLDDLLGAKPFRDVDRFLMDDEVFGNQHLNDLRNPNMLVDEGDKFGYFYRFIASSINVKGAVDYRFGGWHLSANLTAGTQRLQRRGEYEKELMPGRLSYGKSASYVSNPWSFELFAGYAFYSKHFVDFKLKTGEIAPFADNIFLNPEYSNLTINTPKNIKLINSEIDYSAIWERAGLSVTAFFTTTKDETAVYRYWDDLAGKYSQMAVNQLFKHYVGAEIGGEFEISSRFSLIAGFALGNYTYGADAQVVIYDDATQQKYVDGASARIKKYHLATSPERAATIELEYDTWGWIASLSASYVGGRYVMISPLRRMERIYKLNLSPESHYDMVKQEKLDDAFTLNLFIMRSLEMLGGRFTVTASINNLLGKNIVYHGYEQMRVRQTDVTGNWKPFGSKYLFNYGRTYYVSATYSF